MREQLLYILHILYGSEMRGAQRHLSEITGFKQSTISGWVTGQRKPGRDAVDKFVECFNIDMHYLLHGGIYVGLCKRIDGIIKYRKRQMVDDFLKETGVSIHQIKPIINCQVNPSIVVVEKICNRYAINRFYLIGGPTVASPPIYSNPQDIVSAYVDFKKELDEFRGSLILRNENHELSNNYLGGHESFSKSILKKKIGE